MNEFYHDQKEKLANKRV